MARARREERSFLVGRLPEDAGAEVRFYVSKFKGRLYAHIRKHVKRPGYEGPTSSGVALAGENVAAIQLAVEALDPASAGPERELARVPRGVGSDLVARVSVYKEKPALDFREWIMSGGYTGWSRKGVRIPYESLALVKDYLRRMEVFFRRPAARA